MKVERFFLGITINITSYFDCNHLTMIVRHNYPFSLHFIDLFPDNLIVSKRR